MRHRVCLGIALAAAAACLPAAASADGLEAAPVTRLPFPERGYVVSVPEAAHLGASRVEVRENGVLVDDLRVDAVGDSGLRFGVVLAVDASESMAGKPFAAALRAARAFVGQRDPATKVGLVAFNGDVTVLAAPTTNGRTLADALRTPPELAYGTRIYDGLERSLGLLRRARVSAGSVVLLSDGADIGSVHGLEDVVGAARRDRVRIFTIGLRSRAFDATRLRSIADRTGGSYTEARSAAELGAIYASLGRRLASEYLVRYRSDARPEAVVDVEISVAGVGETAVVYVAPTPARVAPYHRSFGSRLLLSPASVGLIGLLGAALLAGALILVARGPARDHVERIGQFSAPAAQSPSERQSAALAKALPAARYTHGWWARLERDLEVARMTKTPVQIAAATATGVCVLGVALFLFSPILAPLGLLAPPLAARTVIRWKLKRLRDEFADQLPAALQVLASALRAGHSFSGALGVVVENTHEPIHSELRRVAHDEQLGVAPEVAIRRMAERMANRDLEQIALLAELQRTSGGNSAEVLDTVVETIRQRGELRRLVRTLTAQGRMARWILTALPAVLTLFLLLMQPEIMGAFFRSSGGQIALLAAILMVAAGSILIQRIVDIKV